jgi:hypothetical protein
MKRIAISVIFIFVTLTLNSQVLAIDPVNNKYKIEAVAKVSALSQKQLFDKTYEWLNTCKYIVTRKDLKNGFKIDTSNFKITATAFFNPDKDNLYGGSMLFWDDMTNFRIGFILTMDFKDGKLRYNYTDFYYYSMANGIVTFESDNFKNRDTILRDRILQATQKYILNSINELVIYLISFENRSDW